MCERTLRAGQRAEQQREKPKKRAKQVMAQFLPRSMVAEFKRCYTGRSKEAAAEKAEALQAETLKARDLRAHCGVHLQHMSYWAGQLKAESDALRVAQDELAMVMRHEELHVLFRQELERLTQENRGKSDKVC